MDRRLLRRIRRLAYPLSLAPLFAFLYCLAAAYQVAEVTVYTHCLVDNFAVSVSEAVSTPDTSLKVSAPLCKLGILLDFLIFGFESSGSMSQMAIALFYQKKWDRKVF